MADVIPHNFWYVLGLGGIDFDSDTLKFALCTSPLASPIEDLDTWESGSSPYDDEISGSGYTAGGATVTGTVTDQDSPTKNVKFDISDPTWTASGGSIPTAGTFTYGVLYVDSVSSPQVKPLVYIRDYTTGQSANDNATITDQIDSNGLFTVS